MSRIGWGGWILLALSGWAQADPPERLPPPALFPEEAGTIPAADLSDPHRAGNPHWLFRWAIPSDTGSYVGYQVGGGCPRPLRAEAPYDHEGTWGWDYQGWLFPRRVILGWWHGRRYQGGTGAYKTDGPSLHFGEGTLRDLKRNP